MKGLIPFRHRSSLINTKDSIKGKTIIKRSHWEDFFLRWAVKTSVASGAGRLKTRIFFQYQLVEMLRLRDFQHRTTSSRQKHPGRCYKTQRGCICQGAESGAGIFSRHQGLCFSHPHVGFLPSLFGTTVPLTNPGRQQMMNYR